MRIYQLSSYRSIGACYTHICNAIDTCPQKTEKIQNSTKLLNDSKHSHPVLPLLAHSGHLMIKTRCKELLVKSLLYNEQGMIPVITGQQVQALSRNATKLRGSNTQFE